MFITLSQVAYGGPIIAFQVENEYAQATEPSKAHMVFLYNVGIVIVLLLLLFIVCFRLFVQLMRRLGGVELFVTSDGGNDMEEAIELLPDKSGQLANGSTLN